MNGEAGKGDTYRPVDQQRYSENWERIFGKQERMQTWWTCERCGKSSRNGDTPCPVCGYKGVDYE